jgi:hypothetical protein
MAKENNNRSVAGEWFGNYYYAGSGHAFGFEAVFIESNGSVEGNILDHGRLGEAQVVGTYAAPALNFTKIYRATSPVTYSGTMSDDGNMLIGTWRIDKASSGTWAAWRNNEDEDDETLDTDRDLDFSVDQEEEREREKQRPMVAPAKAR